MNPAERICDRGVRPLSGSPSGSPCRQSAGPPWDAGISFLPLLEPLHPTAIRERTKKSKKRKKEVLLVHLVETVLEAPVVCKVFDCRQNGLLKLVSPRVVFPCTCFFATSMPACRGSYLALEIVAVGPRTRAAVSRVPASCASCFPMVFLYFRSASVAVGPLPRPPRTAFWPSCASVFP